MNPPRSGQLPLAADLYGDLLEPTTHQRARLVDYWPGLALTGIAALAAAWISEHYGAPRMLMGLLIGLAFNFANADKRLHPGLGFASKSLLRWGIVLAGLQITVGQIAGFGWEGLAILVGTVALVIGTGAAIARGFGLSSAFGVLSGGAVAICGASAAMAIFSVLGDRRISQAQLTLVLVIVAAASALAMSVYPVIATTLEMSGRQSGWLLGASIHDVAQALGAGYSISDEAGQTAAIVKLARVALLAPMLAVLAYFYRSGKDASQKSIEFPWFVLGFLALGLANSLVSLPPVVTQGAGQITEICLLLAVTATGIRSPMHLLLGQGVKPIAPVIGATLAAFGISLLASYAF